MIDRIIVHAIQATPYISSTELEIRHNISQIRQKLSYLEKAGVIWRIPNFSSDIMDQQWAPFGMGMNLLPQDPILSQCNLLLRILAMQPPLTALQITRYFGWSYKELQDVLDVSLRSGKIIEGYFISGVGDMQYTLPQSNFASSKLDDTIYIIPSTDPLGIFHFTDFLSAHPNLIPQEKVHVSSKLYLIWNKGEIQGYITRLDHSNDYTLNFQLATLNDDFLFQLLETCERVFHLLIPGQGIIGTINKTPVSNPQFVGLIFTIELLGFQVALNF
jgi:hypothetical protein